MATHNSKRAVAAAAGALALALAVASAGGCAGGCGNDACPEATSVDPGAELLCEVDGFDDRAYRAFVPPSWSPAEQAPVLVLLHGGGGQRDAIDRQTCPDGDRDSAGCLSALAAEQGWIFVLGQGTRVNDLLPSRNWNAGGGTDGWWCAAGAACAENVDDVGYFSALLDDVEARLSTDADWVFVAGFSLGAAMTYRLACELPSRVSAIAPVAGGNMAAVGPAGCDPRQSMPVLHIHGTADPNWAYAGGAVEDLDGLEIVGARQSIVGDDEVEGWVARNGCQADPSSSALPDAADDGTTASEELFDGCADAVQVRLISVEGGGHTWPGGFAPVGEDLIGPLSMDFSASQRVVDFFKALRAD